MEAGGQCPPYQDYSLFLAMSWVMFDGSLTAAAAGYFAGLRKRYMNWSV